MDLAVIIVNFNTKEKLRDCLQSVFNSQTRYNFQVWVVDNASGDGSAEMVKKEFPQVRLIENQENVGFAKASNQALRQARGRYYLLLNSDAEVLPDTFDKMIFFMDNNPTVGISGCKVVKGDGKLDLACRRSFPNPVNAFFRVAGLSFLFAKSRMASYNLTYLPEDEVVEVDSVMGAFLLIRREVMEQIGLLDEDFFMYGEDLDWCYRAKKAGFKVMYVPLTTVIHHKGSSSRRVPGKALLEFHRAMQLFYDKYYQEKYNFLVNALVKIGIWARYLVKVLENFLRKEKFISK
jgi:hypothetical protein